jgi:iron complex outermembrane recepter protein
MARDLSLSILGSGGAALLAVAAATSPVFAQQAASSRATADVSGLEEVVVSARKREETLLEVPLSITAFTAEQIERQQIFDIRDLSAVSPGMTFQPVGGNGPGGRFGGNLYFRGLTFSAPLPRQQTGAVFVDGVYVLGGVQAINTIDVERIEVIKGPQNAYFGRNTFGGAINYITRAPSETFKAQIGGFAETRESLNGSLTVEGPIWGEALRGRAAFLFNRKGGHYRSNDGTDLGEEETQSFTGTLLFQPNESFSARVRFHWQQDEDSPATSAHLSGGLHGTSCSGITYSNRFNDGSPRTFQVGIPYFCSGIPTLSQLGERNIISSNTQLVSRQVLAAGGSATLLSDAFLNNRALIVNPMSAAAPCEVFDATRCVYSDPLIARAPDLDHFGLKREVMRFTTQLQYTFGNDISAVLNFGRNINDTMAIVDPDRSDFENSYTATPALFSDTAYEFRVASGQEQRLRWLLGVNSYEGKFDAHFNGAVNYQVANAPMSPIPVVMVQNQPPNRDGEIAKVRAVFGSVDFDITDTLTATLEARYQKDEAQLAVPLFGGLTQPAVAEFTDTMPRAILKWQPTERLNLYASWAKGVLPGQFNAQYLNPPNPVGGTSDPAFVRSQIEAAFPGVSELAPSQEIESLEIGIKQRLWDDRLEYSVAIYSMEWSKMLSGSALTVRSRATVTQPDLILTGVLIPGDSEIEGLEFEGTARITENWDVNLRLDTKRTEYVRFFDPFIQQLTGNSANGVRFDGNELPRIPQTTGSIASTYRDRLNDTWEWYVRGEANYTGKAWESAANLVQTDAYTRVNLRLGFEKDNLLTELYCKNCLDDDSWDYAFRSVSFREPGGSLLVTLPLTPPALGFQQGIIVQPPDKRVVGVRFRYSFD